MAAGRVGDRSRRVGSGYEPSANRRRMLADFRVVILEGLTFRLADQLETIYDSRSLVEVLEASPLDIQAAQFGDLRTIVRHDSDNFPIGRNFHELAALRIVLIHVVENDARNAPHHF